MLSGECPFIGDTDYAISSSVMSGNWRPIDEVVNFIPSSISHVISQSMQKGPVARYPTAKAFIDALGRAIGRPLSPDDQEEIPNNELGAVVLDMISEVEEELQFEDRSLKASDYLDTDDYDSNEELYTDEYETQEEHFSENENFDEHGNRIYPDDEKSDDVKSIFYEENKKVRAIDKRRSAPKVKSKKVKKKQQYGWVHVVLISLMSLWIYMSFIQGRDVFFNITDFPDWGERYVFVDGVQTEDMEFPVMSLGSHNITLRGGLYEDGECLRCCWEKPWDFSVGIGIGELILDVSALQEDGTPFSCPTQEFMFAFSYIPPGEFEMGSNVRSVGRDRDEIQHKVQITKGFFISQTEVTQGIFENVTGENPSANKGDEMLPADSVSWFDAVQFCNMLSEAESLEPCYVINNEDVSWESGLECEGYRLPTEAEWEFAARAEKKKPYSGSDLPDEVAWYAQTGLGSQPVGMKRANSWLLYDMSGNVSEWVWDWYGAYQPELFQDPKGPLTGDFRIIRGGDWQHTARLLRVSDRNELSPRYPAPYVGFRVVRSE